MLTTSIHSFSVAPQFSGKRKDRKKAVEQAFQSQLPETKAEKDLNYISYLEREKAEMEKEIERVQHALAEKMDALPSLEEETLSEEVKVLLSNVDEKKLHRFLRRRARKTAHLQSSDKKALGGLFGISAAGVMGAIVLSPMFVILPVMFAPLLGAGYFDSKKMAVADKWANVNPERFARVLIAEGVLTVKDLEKMQKKG